MNFAPDVPTSMVSLDLVDQLKKFQITPGQAAIVDRFCEEKGIRTFTGRKCASPGAEPRKAKCRRMTRMQERKIQEPPGGSSRDETVSRFVVSANVHSGATQGRLVYDARKNLQAQGLHCEMMKDSNEEQPGPAQEDEPIPELTVPAEGTEEVLAPRVRRLVRSLHGRRGLKATILPRR